MTYQELQDILRRNKLSQAVPVAPSLDQIISGIQSQYQPVSSMPAQSGMYGANRYVTGTPQFGAIEQIPEFGRLNQMAGPSFVPSAFDKSLYEKVDTQKLSDLISQIDSGVGNDGGATGGLSIGDSGLASSSNIGTTGVTLGAMALGAMTGLPASLAASIVGKESIANALNAQSHAQAAAFNNALVAEQMGLTNSPANAAALASAIDSLSAANPASQASISAAQAAQGVAGTTGGSAAAAGAAAAAAASAAGYSDAAIGAAAQAAADAAMGGASAAAAAAAAADAANAAAADAADAEGGGLGVGGLGGLGGSAAGNAAADGVGMDGLGVGGFGGGGAGGSDSGGGVGAGNDGGGIGAGEGLAKGGMVSKRHLAGSNPTGPDDGYAALNLGEYVIKQSSVDKYGTEIFDLINQGKISKKAIKSLL